MSAEALATRPALRTLTVAAVRPVATDTVEITFADPAGPLPAWTPGDHVTVEFAPGVSRQYSLCGRPDEPTWTIAVRRDPHGRGGSALAHATVAGATLRVHGPRAAFPLDDAERHVLIAGGIGVTPILTMAEALRARGASFTLHVFDRGADRFVYADRVVDAGGVLVDRATDTTTLADVLAAGPDALVYACGPHGMLTELAALVPVDRLRVEDFAPAVTEPAIDDADAAAGSVDDDGAFEVQLGRDGEVHEVPAGCSLLDVMLKAGVDVVWSCREGNCASCETPVLSGIPDHRDVILDEDEKAANDVIFPCVSRCRSGRLVLDV